MNRMIPSDSIHVDKNGDVVIKKNLEVNRLKPTGEYHIANWTLKSYGTFEGYEPIQILGIGDVDGNYSCIGLGYFELKNQEVVSLCMAGFDYYNDNILYYSLKTGGTIEVASYTKTTITQ